jgi:hypothetical protein
VSAGSLEEQPFLTEKLRQVSFRRLHLVKTVWAMTVPLRTGVATKKKG